MITLEENGQSGQSSSTKNFYETDHYKPIREKLDCKSDAADVVELVTQEQAAFTDYLNFFEVVSFVASTHQLSEKDVLSLFHYYLRCLKRHTLVMKYLFDKGNGFEHLSGFLKKTGL